MADFKTDESDKTKKPGEVPKGTDRPDNRDGDQKTVSVRNSGARTVLVQGGLTDVAGGTGPNRGVVFGDERDRMPGTFIMPNAVSRNTWQKERARLEAKQADVHAANVANQKARHDALMADVKAAGKRADARKEALANGTDFSSLGKINSDLWNGWGKLNGQDGANGSMLDTKGRASDIAALNKWFNSAEAQQYRGYIPAGVATRDMKNGVREFSLVDGGANLTTAQFDALMQVKAQSDKRFADIRKRAQAASGASQWDKDMQTYLDHGGKVEFDKETGVMKTDRKAISAAADIYRRNDAVAALRGFNEAASGRIRRDVGDIVGDEVAGMLDDMTAERARGKAISSLQAAGLNNRQIFKDDGSGEIDVDKISGWLGWSGQGSSPKAARKAARKAAPKATPGAAPTRPVSPDLGNFTELRTAARDVQYPTVSMPMDRLRRGDPLAAAGIRVRGMRTPVGTDSGMSDVQRSTQIVPRTPPSISDGRIPESDDFASLMSGSRGAMNDAAGYARLRQAIGPYNPDAATWHDPKYRQSMGRATASGAAQGALLGMELSGAGKLVGMGARAGVRALSAAARRRAAVAMAPAATSGALSKGVRKATQGTLVNAFTKEAPVATVAGASQVPGGAARAAERYYAGVARAVSRATTRKAAAKKAAATAARRRAGAAAARAAKAEEAAYTGQAVEAAMERKGFKAAAKRAARRRHN